MSTRTLVLLKPDAVERGLVGAILSRFEQKGLKLVGMELRTLDADILARHYEEHVGKGFYGELVAFMGRGPVVALAVEGEEEIRVVGARRADVQLTAAEREIGIFFPNL